MTEEPPHGPGIAALVIPMPGSVRPPTDSAAAMIAWLFAHGAPRTADVLSRLQRDAWTIEPPSPDAATQTELWATSRFADVEQASHRAAPGVLEVHRSTPRLDGTAGPLDDLEHDHARSETSCASVRGGVVRQLSDETPST
jgi:hypothetical protein